ncbi:hypothetical protein D3C76_1360910 [compost metagenome]
MHRISGGPYIRNAGLQRHLLLYHITGLHTVISIIPHVEAIECSDIGVSGENQAEIHHLIDTGVDLTGQKRELFGVGDLQFFADDIIGDVIRVGVHD